VYRNTVPEWPGGIAVKVLRFVVPALFALGLAVCAHAVGRLMGLVPEGRLAPYPAWTALHFATASLFAIIAALQLWPGLRARRPDLHRQLGRLGVGVGLAMAATGLAMAYLTPDRPVSLRIFMTVYIASYAALLALGLRAALVRSLPAHRAWMVRMVATALAPMTQRLLLPFLIAVVGVDGRETFWQLFVSAAWIGWGLNMLVAESWLRADDPRRRLVGA
jgi:hypothetical protein